MIMRKVFVLLFLCSLMMISFIGPVYSQDEDTSATEEMTSDTGMAEEIVAEEPVIEEPEPPAEEALAAIEEPVVPEAKGHQLLKKYFIEGGAGFMGIILLCLITGLAFAIERIITLNLATTNTSKLLDSVSEALKSGGKEQAQEVCKSTRGPVASIFYQGLERMDQGIEMVEKSIVSYGSVQMGLLEKGLVWIALFISLAPMLGFMGTVIGMISAFDAIEIAGDISPGLVAGGIKIALLTTVFGLIVAIILQLFYNYIVSKIDDLVNKMEDSSILFVDMIAKHKGN